MTVKCDVYAGTAVLCGAFGWVLGWALALAVATPALRLLAPHCGLLGGLLLGWRGLPPLFATRPTKTRIGMAAVLALGMCLLLLGVNALVQWLSSTPLPPQPLVSALKNAGLPRWLLIGFSTVFLAPFAEELAFRLALPRSLELSGLPKWCIVVLVSLLFAFCHGIVWGLPALFLFSVLQFWVRDRYDLLEAMLVHSFFNLGNLLLLLYAR